MSFQAIAVNFYLRHFFKPAPNTPIHVERARERMNALAAKQLPPPADIHCTPLEATDTLCAAEMFVTDSSDATILYFHGGGYFFGTVATHRPVCAYLSRTAKARVISVDYRLAPEHPYPEAIQDALAWYTHLLKTTAPGKLFVAGDSAGAGLALACLLSARTQQLPMPAGALLFSPWVDLSCSGQSMQTMAQADVMFNPDSLPKAAQIYLQGRDATDPLASPLFADLTGLPPLLIFASNTEVLLDDARRLHDKAIAAGVQSRLELRSGVPHAWPTMLILPEARACLRETGQFVAAQKK